MIVGTHLLARGSPPPPEQTTTNPNSKTGLSDSTVTDGVSGLISSGPSAMNLELLSKTIHASVLFFMNLSCFGDMYLCLTITIRLSDPHEISLCPEAVDGHLDDGQAVSVISPHSLTGLVEISGRPFRGSATRDVAL